MAAGEFGFGPIFDEFFSRLVNQLGASSKPVTESFDYLKSLVYWAVGGGGEGATTGVQQFAESSIQINRLVIVN